jgi:hypothetical protein
MDPGEALGQVEFAVLCAVHRGALHSRRGARDVPVLDDRPAAETIFHEVLRGFEHEGLLPTIRDGIGRDYVLTAAGRARLRSEKRFRSALVKLLAHSG